MAFDFPNSPTTNQIFTGSNGAQYQWNGTVWNQVSGNPGSLTAQTRNRLVNGAMQISQELVKGTTYTTSAQYPADQWAVVGSVGGLAFACNDGGNAGPSFIALNSTVATASPAVGDYYMLSQPIEGRRINDFQWSGATARQVVLRFDAYPTVAGTIGVSIRAGDNSRSYVKNVALTAGGWNTYTVVIPGDTAGVWATDTSKGATLYFAVMGGSNLIGVEGWQAGTKVGAPGMSNYLAVVNQSVNFRNVGLYLDPDNTGVPPAWSMPDEAQELAACQRYYFKASSGQTNVYHYGAASTGFSDAGLIPFFAQMRIAPAAAIATAPTLTNCSGPTLATTPYSGILFVTVTATGVYVAPNGVYAFNARM